MRNVCFFALSSRKTANDGAFWSNSLFLTNVNWLYRAELHKMFSIQLSKVISLKKAIYLPFLCPGMMVMVCGTVTNLLVFCGFQWLKNAHIIIWGVIEIQPFLYDFYKLILGKPLRYHTHITQTRTLSQTEKMSFPFSHFLGHEEWMLSR